MKFLLAKNRVVARNRQTKSIPVLELFSMEFAVEKAVGLYVELSNMFEPVNISRLHIYSDSMISLNWLVYKVCKLDKIERKGSYINNKLNSIVKLCKKIPESFYHVCGLDNLADKVTRCVSSAVLRGPTQKFGQKLQFFLFAEKASSGMWEICPKILGGYEY